MRKKESMTETEKKVFRIISDDPMIPQNEIAYRANISRSSVSVHISNLIKKGYITGRGYVISDYENVVLIGAAMIDLYGKSFDAILDRESNPGEVRIYPGGVSRNISENLARLGTKVSLITAICDDPFGKVIRKSCEDLGIDLSHSYFPENEVSTIYLALVDHDGEMRLALSDTKALDNIPLEHIIRKETVISRGEVIVVDACLPSEVMRYIVEHHSDKRIIVDPVSIGKAHKIVDFIGRFHTLKCNRNEAEFLSGQSITDQESLEKAADSLMEKGIKELFITLGSEGVYYQNQDKRGKIPSYAKRLVNASGAGDAFTAGVAYCSLLNTDIEETARFASALSSLALESMSAVNPDITVHEVNTCIEKHHES